MRLAPCAVQAVVGLASDSGPDSAPKFEGTKGHSRVGQLRRSNGSSSSSAGSPGTRATTCGVKPSVPALDITLSGFFPVDFVSLFESGASSAAANGVRCLDPCNQSGGCQRNFERRYLIDPGSELIVVELVCGVLNGSLIRRLPSGTWTIQRLHTSPSASASLACGGYARSACRTAMRMKQDEPYAFTISPCPVGRLAIGTLLALAQASMPSFWD
ncbi:hypothetical protein BPA30113_06497 [Burkholderia paludis]|uniref:Uncharacterized protein n=1 Tax=Burkholderia paludis TaxID=1506587 RepID=A0A6P2RCX1_9BURK|nr:hypothetical protein LMG30113_06030 [Burkholderia paludis]VWC34544.1 hypothetical protein BPA30113_06497 [Burkholderia paludis]